MYFVLNRPWSSGRTGDTGWPDSGAGDAANDMKEAQWSTPTQPSLTDLVPEFEPGKPWKVTIECTLKMFRRLSVLLFVCAG